MAASSPLFSFAHATDLHVESGSEPAFPLANDRTACLVRDINASAVSFVLLSGDVSNRGSKTEADLDAARELIEGFNVPVHIIAGNHDISASRHIDAKYPGIEPYQEMPLEQTGFARVFGAEGLRFSFEEQGHCFVGITLRDEDPDGQLDWLEGELASAAGNCFVVTHYGLYPPRDAGHLSRWGFTRISAVRERLQDIIAKAGTKVLAYLHGHDHINSVMKIGESYHISGGAVQKGCTGYRRFDCYADRVESSFHPLSDPKLVNYNFWTIFIDPEELVDSKHKTVEEYHRGNDREQDLVIRHRP